MDYLEREFSGIAKCGTLYDSDPLKRANQEMIMAKTDQLAFNLYTVLMSRGQDQPSYATMTKALDFLNMQLEISKTEFFNSKESYSMEDLFAFPFVSRLFYLKDSELHYMYESLDLENRYKYLFRWFKAIQAKPELNDGRAIIPVNAFKNWLVELSTTPLGKKPPLRLPTKL